MKKPKTENKAVQLFDERARNYAEKFMDVSSYSQSLDFLGEQLYANSQVLELACGPGNITKYLLNHKPDLQILASDLSPRMLEIARKNNPAAKFLLLDIKNISQLQTKFDALVCGFCLPYLEKGRVKNFFYDCHTVLNAKGLLYLSTMEGEYKNSGDILSSDKKDSIFTYFYSEEFLTTQLLKNNFETIKVFKVASSGYSQSINDIAIIARKKS